MNTIKSQLASIEWQLWKEQYLDENNGDGCFTCGSWEKLDVHINKFYSEIANIWDYPNEAYSVHCFDCRKQKKQLIKEILSKVSTWQLDELSVLLDILDTLESTKKAKLFGIHRLYTMSKEL
ncbi:hypothetical protein ACEO96_14915 [Vibrio anguillarum]|uniref:hypothetical protein n=1 Tax=Vibrio anguillarum TaxID=55601 RepID=UPI00359330FA